MIGKDVWHKSENALKCIIVPLGALVFPSLGINAFTFVLASIIPFLTLGVLHTFVDTHRNRVGCWRLTWPRCGGDTCRI